VNQKRKKFTSGQKNSIPAKPAQREGIPKTLNLSFDKGMLNIFQIYFSHFFFDFYLIFARF
jgi:hypothetical protein